MLRKQMIDALTAHTGEWDICIIGGGATGLGTAVDAASRGYKTILFERSDFAKGTSSRSTKLVHGGVRYLQQGNIKLVMEALQERGRLKKNAPHLVKNQSFLVPNYKWWEGGYYGLGLKVYDWMAGSLGLGSSIFLSLEETLEKAPTLYQEGLRGGVIYHDGQFDDARLAINLAQTAASEGATLLNYCEVTGFEKEQNNIKAVEVHEKIGNRKFTIRAKAFINATGVFSDSLLRMDDTAAESIIAPSQGVHIVLDQSFLPGDTAVLVPHTDDGRVLFAVPWHSKIIVGTTDTPMEKISTEPMALPEEIDFILDQIARYLSKTPTRRDIRSVFAGLRPLVKSTGKKTAEISRDHLILVSDSGLITITGGKWTTYRRMAQDVVDTAAKKTGLAEKACITENLPIHGARENTDFHAPLYYYGTDQAGIEKLIEQNPDWKQLLHPDLPYIKAEIIWAVRNEMCETVDDALARRTRALLLDAQASISVAPVVAALMAEEMQYGESWIEEQVRDFESIARNYLAF